ncbi:MAG: glycosyltransferase [Methanolinea sp.]|nr:glycosyltransferase [Methanolinea sp.]
MTKNGDPGPCQDGAPGDVSGCPGVPYSLVIPAYNEERRIETLLAQLEGAPGEIIFVCEGEDATPVLIRRFSDAHPDLRIRSEIRRERLGKGRAILQGLSLSTAPLVGYMDADGSTSFDEMLRLFSRLDSADAIIGSRWKEGAVLLEPQGIARRVQSRVFNLFIRLLFGLSFKDTQCGAKVFKKSAIDAVLKDMVSRGFEFDVELLWRLQSGGFRIREVPISWNNMGDSRVKVSDIARMAISLVKMRFFR